jgi:hypothetical protein
MAQLGNAFACRSERSTVFEVPPARDRMLLVAVAADVGLLVAYLGVPQVADLLGGGWPSPLGWLCAAAAAVVLIAVGPIAKLVRRHLRTSSAARPRAGLTGPQ